MNVDARRAWAMMGGTMLGIAVGVAAPSVVATSSEGMVFLGGLFGGVGIGIMVAMSVRE